MLNQAKRMEAEAKGMIAEAARMKKEAQRLDPKVSRDTVAAPAVVTTDSDAPRRKRTTKQKAVAENAVQ
jgi:hypothetical protein